MATKIEIPAFEATAVEYIPHIARTVRGTFSTHKTKNIEWRRVQLRKLYWALMDFTPHMVEALKRDLHKSEYELLLSEIDICKGELLLTLRNLDRWVKDEKPEGIPPPLWIMSYRLRKVPIGPALIIAAYNYPILETFGPLIGAIAAGCTAVMKPSELSPSTAMIFKQMVEERLDKDAFAVVNGAVPETSALLEEKWGKIVYTGGTAVGTIIAKKAAETLTPVTLELGGKNPAIVTKNANLALAARRLLWAKVLNAGQVCMSQNYILIEKEALNPFVEELKKSYKDFFPNGAKASSDYARIINVRHFQRLKKMIDDSKGKIVLGGQLDESELFVEPTAVVVNSTEDSMMAQESFGPIFAIYPVNNVEEAILVANSVDSTPLTLFSFGSKAENERVLRETISGGATTNDAFMHGSSAAPFGGVGTSGYGTYRGKASFDTFVHVRTIAHTPAWAEPFIRVRYMPYKWSELNFLRRVSKNHGDPGFDRNGKVVRGIAYWAGLVAGLGSSSAKGAFFRWLVTLLAAAYYTGYFKQ